MDDPSCTRDPRAFWPKYSSCPLISAHEFWQSIRPRWYHCYNFAFLSRLVPICKNVFQNYYFYSYLLYIFMLSLFILSSELLNSRSLWRLHFFLLELDFAIDQRTNSNLTVWNSVRGHRCVQTHAFSRSYNYLKLNIRLAHVRFVNQTIP